jgi:hypothetical protein
MLIIDPLDNKSPETITPTNQAIETNQILKQATIDNY